MSKFTVSTASISVRDLDIGIAELGVKMWPESEMCLVDDHFLINLVHIMIHSCLLCKG